MRTKDTLKEFEEVKIFFEYLYMSDEHRITFFNGITNLQLRMTDNINTLCKNMSFPDSPEMYWDSEMNPSTILAIIEILRKQPAEEFPKSFKSRWEEIRTITQSNVYLNIGGKK